MQYTYDDRIAVEEYLALRRAVNWSPLAADQARLAEFTPLKETASFSKAPVSCIQMVWRDSPSEMTPLTKQFCKGAAFLLPNDRMLVQSPPSAEKRANAKKRPSEEDRFFVALMLPCNWATSQIGGATRIRTGE